MLTSDSSKGPFMIHAKLGIANCDKRGHLVENDFHHFA
jgi:hypothetical protein